MIIMEYDIKNESVQLSRDNIYCRTFSVTRDARELLNGHPSGVVWLTGLSGAGKSSLADSLESKLHVLGKRTYVLDGDNVRHGLNKDLDFTEAGRDENIRRVAEVAKLMMDAGLIVITAFISPFRDEREMARTLIGAENFVEVYLSTPLSVCEERDSKGLYKLARAGRIQQMTGITSAYEIPEQPAFVADMSSETADHASERLLASLWICRGGVTGADD